jgi:hypothetical protein
VRFFIQNFFFMIYNMNKLTKILTTITIAFFFFACKPSTSQNTEGVSKEKCYSNQKEIFDEFSAAVKAKDISRLRKITYDTVTIHIDYDSLLGKYQNPSIEFMPKESDGNYGIENIGTKSIYSSKILDNGMKKDICGITFDKRGDCFKVIDISPIIINSTVNTLQTGNISKQTTTSNLSKSQNTIIKTKSQNTIVKPKSQTIIVRIPSKDTTFYQGEQGGCYYLNSSGNKVYVEKERCGTFTPNKTKYIVQQPVKKQEIVVVPRNIKPVVKKVQKEGTETRTYITGKRGGCYYINSKGNKVYVDKSLCN